MKRLGGRRIYLQRGLLCIASGALNFSKHVGNLSGYVGRVSKHAGTWVFLLSTVTIDVGIADPIVDIAAESRVESGRTNSSNETQSCQADDAPVTVVPTAADVPRDRSCYISAKNALQSRDQANFVDVRAAQDYERSHIDGSINLPLHSLKTKPFLKQKPVILVGRGIVNAPLEQECSVLKALGYQVSILRGGVPAWHLQGGTFSGSIASDAAIGTLSAPELFEAMNSEKLTTAYLSAAPARAPPKTFAKAVVLDRTKPAIAVRKLQQIRSRDGDATPIVIADTTGEHYALIQDLVRNAHLSNVWYLAGGAVAYDAFLSHQTVMWQRIEHPPRRRCTG